MLARIVVVGLLAVLSVPLRAAQAEVVACPKTQGELQSNIYDMMTKIGFQQRDVLGEVHFAKEVPTSGAFRQYIDFQFVTFDLGGKSRIIVKPTFLNRYLSPTSLPRTIIIDDEHFLSGIQSALDAMATKMPCPG